MDLSSEQDEPSIFNYAPTAFSPPYSTPRSLDSQDGPSPVASSSSSEQSMPPTPRPSPSCSPIPYEPMSIIDSKASQDLPPNLPRRAQYACLHPGCERVLMSMYTRQVHMTTHRPKTRKVFTCSLGCAESFTRQHDRQRHEVLLHGKKCEHICSRCERFFSSQKMLERHTCRGRRHGSIRWPLADDEETSAPSG